MTGPARRQPTLPLQTVVNMSFGQQEDSPAVARATAAAGRLGMILVAAAGNDAADGGVDFPARLPGVLAVTGTDAADRLMRHASRGPELDLAAPGIGIVSLARDGGRRTLSGTSMAAPHVAGAAALLLAARPGLSPAEVHRVLQETADPLQGPAADLPALGVVRVDRAAAALGIPVDGSGTPTAPEAAAVGGDA